MEKVKNESKKVKPSKKVLVAQLMDAGVDPKIVKSLERANIDTLTWVKGLISSQAERGRKSPSFLGKRLDTRRKL